MKILHVTDCYPPGLGGIEAHVAALATRQAASGHEVTVLTSARGGPDAGPVEVRRVRTVVDGLRLDHTRFDQVHAHLSVVSPFTAPVATMAARRGVPTLVTVHSLWGSLAPVPAVAAALCGLRAAPVVWSAVSRVAAREVSRQLPGGPEVLVLPNSVDVGARPSTLLRSAGEPVQLVSTMRITRRKRPLALLRLFETLVRESRTPVHLTVVGDGPDRSRLERRVRRARLAGAVTITGRVPPEAVRDHLARADVYVAPAVLESFGLAALEARCVGVPVVGFATSGVADFVEHGREGLLGTTDAELLALVRRLVEDPGLRLGLAEHNRTTSTDLTWPHTESLHAAAYALARHRQGLGAPAVGPAIGGGR